MLLHADIHKKAVVSESRRSKGLTAQVPDGQITVFTDLALILRPQCQLKLTHDNGLEKVG